MADYPYADWFSSTRFIPTNRFRGSDRFVPDAFFFW